MTKGEPQKEYIITIKQKKGQTKVDEKSILAYLEYGFAYQGENRIVVRSRPAATSNKVLVYEYRVPLPSKTFPSITRRKLALNDIGENEDGFTRIDFELKDGDVIQVVRQRRGEENEQKTKNRTG